MGLDATWVLFLIPVFLLYRLKVSLWLIPEKAERNAGRMLQWGDDKKKNGEGGATRKVSI